MSLFDAWLFCKTHAAKWTTIFSGRLESHGANYMERDRDREREREKKEKNRSDEPRSEHLVAIVLGHLG